MRGVEPDRVVALLLVLDDDRQLAEIDVPLLQIVLAGDRAQIEDLGVLAPASSRCGRCRAAGCPPCRPPK